MGRKKSNEKVSNKIRKLIKEGKPQDEAIAQALGMTKGKKEKK